MGVKNSHGEYILILNPDVFVNEDTIQKMLNYMEKHPEVGVLGPRQLYPDGTVQDSCRRDMSLYDLFLKRTFLGKLPFFRKRVNDYTMKDFDHSKTREVDLLVGSCFLIPREVYEQVGGFDERYFLFMEDFDLCKEVRELGKKIVYYPEAEVTHNHKRLSGGSVFGLIGKKVFWIHMSSAVKYFWKWKGQSRKEKSGGCC